MTAIHHITHIANLPAIVREDAIVCDGEVEQRGLCTQSIAYDTIKERRRRRVVQTLAGQPVAAGGVVADYVPFYFTNRSPMLYAIHRGTVPAYQGGQHDVVYLVSSAETVAASPAEWCFTDGHAVEGVTEFFGDLRDLGRVNWEAVNTWKWGRQHQLANPDVLRAKQAEFLTHRRFPWKLVLGIAVLDESMAKRVQAALAAAAHKPKVTIERKWYYDT
jgi:hypothetical protein